MRGEACEAKQRGVKSAVRGAERPAGSSCATIHGVTRKAREDWCGTHLFYFVLPRRRASHPTHVYRTCGGGSYAPPMRLQTKRLRTLRVLALLCVALALLCVGLRGRRSERSTSVTPSGERLYGVHDPSSLVRDGGHWHVLATGGWGSPAWSGEPGLRRYRSRDLHHWERLLPNALSSVDAALWAPEVVPSRSGAQHLVYYSVSSWGSPRSCIRLAFVPAGRFGDVDEWREVGEVLCSDGSQGYNAIDPAVVRHGRELWLAFGSGWQGVMLTALDAESGLVPLHIATLAPVLNAWGWLNATVPVIALARAQTPEKQRQVETGGDAMVEAPYVLSRGAWWYLFVNWGWCCKRDSSYSVRYGRSVDVFGPYMDREGGRMDQGRGSLLLNVSARDGRALGPGHVSVTLVEGQWLVSFAAYDRDAPQGADAAGARLQVRRLRWTRDDWPVVDDW